jgi:riboflavin biosynthesis pyrimidine reductase
MNVNATSAVTAVGSHAATTAVGATLNRVFSETLAGVLFTELWPQRREVEVDRYVADLRLADRAAAQRPFTIVNFVSSVDGRATLHGRSGPLGDDGDKALFRALRNDVDAVLVGTGTLAAERYGRMIRDPEIRERRRRRGLPPEPLACTVTRTGAVPSEIPLFAEPEARIIVFTCAEVDASAAEAQVEVVFMEPDQISFAAVLSNLRSMHDVRALLCEGGPRVFGALAREGAFDQLFLTVAPKLAGGGNERSITTGPELPDPAAMGLESVLERDGTLFLRYSLSK